MMIPYNDHDNSTSNAISCIKESDNSNCICYFSSSTFSTNQTNLEPIVQPEEDVSILQHKNNPSSIVDPKSHQDHDCLGQTYNSNNNDKRSWKILCGRNKAAFNHMGNRRFRDTISIFLQRYLERTSRPERALLTREIVETIQQSGGRFSKKSSKKGKDGHYQFVELSEKEKRNKVGHALRDAAAKFFAKQKQLERSKHEPTASKDENVDQEVDFIISNEDDFDFLSWVFGIGG